MQEAKLPMPGFPPKRLIPSASSILSSSTPTPEDVAHLILHAKTASQALRTFRWATNLPSFRHTPATSAALIRSLVSLRNLSAAQDALLHHIPFPPDSPSLLPLLRALSPPDALHLLDQMSTRFNTPHPPIQALNAVLHSLVKQDIDAARKFLRSRIIPTGNADEHTFGILMKGLCRTNRIAEAFKLLQLMKKSTSLPPNPVVYNTLIHALCRNGKVGRARSLMSEMDCPSLVTFNILISAYCGEGNLVQALVMLEKSFDLGFVPDNIAVTKIVELLCAHGRAMEAVEVLEQVERRGCVPDVVAYNTLIKGFCGVDKPRVGLRVLREMESKGCLPNVQTYNALIAGFCDLGKMDSAVDTFEEMRADGTRPDFITFDTLIRGFCSGGRIEDGLKFLNLMEEESGGNISPYNSVLYGFYREGRIQEAREFLDRMGSSFPRAVDRTLKILGFCKDGKTGEAKLLYKQMVQEGSAPNAIVYGDMTEAFCRDGMMREAFDLMNGMVGMGFFPVVSTFDAMIHGFCREGRFESAAKLIEDMVGRGCTPGASSYNHLIGALCKEGDLGRSVCLLMRMVERDVVPDHSTWSSLVLSLWANNSSKIQTDGIISELLFQGS